MPADSLVVGMSETWSGGDRYRSGAMVTTVESISLTKLASVLPTTQQQRLLTVLLQEGSVSWH